MNYECPMAKALGYNVIQIHSPGYFGNKDTKNNRPVF